MNSNGFVTSWGLIILSNLSPSQFLKALLNIHQSDPILFAHSKNPQENINILTGKLLIETKGQCDVDLSYKLMSSLVSIQEKLK